MTNETEIVTGLYPLHVTLYSLYKLYRAELINVRRNRAVRMTTIIIQTQRRGGDAFGVPTFCTPSKQRQ